MEAIAKTLKALVADAVPKIKALDNQAAATRPSTDQWSPKEIVGHLIDSAANNHQRFVRALDAGELNFPPYAQDAWVDLQQYNTADWSDLIVLWQAFNLHLVHLISQVAPEQREYSCVIGSGDPVTLGFLIEDYLTHLKIHFKQLGV